MNKLEDEIKQKLEKLDAIPERNPLRVQSAKKNFLSEMHQLAGETTVSVPTKSWWNQLNIKKETFSMKLITIATILSLLLGGGITAVAAQVSLPGDLLYPVKTLVEDIELGLATDPETEFEVGFKHANKRFDEIQATIELGELPPEPFFFKFQYGLQDTLEAALATTDPTGNLLKVQQLLQNRWQEMVANQGVEKGLYANEGFDHKLQYLVDLIDAGIEEPELLASELEFMAEYSEQNGVEGLEKVLMNMYGVAEEYEVGQVQNQGELQPRVEDPFLWMHQQGLSTDFDPAEYQFGNFGEDKNSTIDHLNAGDNDNGNNGENGGSGGNGDGNGGK